MLCAPPNQLTPPLPRSPRFNANTHLCSPARPGRAQYYNSPIDVFALGCIMAELYMVSLLLKCDVPLLQHCVRLLLTI